MQEVEATVVDGNGTETGHIIVTTIGGRNGQPKKVITSSMKNSIDTESWIIFNFFWGMNFTFFVRLLTPEA